jgi:glycosyltransferase involved in cell wall biosynthesis
VTDVTVVVPARDAAATIERTLSALAAQRVDAGYEVIVVDSGSADATAELARASPSVARVLENPGGEPASSRNLGASAGSGRILAFTDADCAPDPGWLAAGVRALEAAEIVQGAVRPRRTPRPFERTLSVTSEYGTYETASLFVRRATFEAAGGFQPVLEHAGHRTRPFGEDTWFVWRARRAGARTRFAAEAIVEHEVFARTAREFIAERARCRYFPPLVALVPELRGPFLHRRWFLSPASLRFDLALAGLVAGGLRGRRRWAALGLGLYLAPLAAEPRRLAPEDRWRVPAARLAADAVTFAALLRGSIDARTLVL